MSLAYIILLVIYDSNIIANDRHNITEILLQVELNTITPLVEPEFIVS